MTLDQANVDQIRTLVKTADAETLREVVNILLDKLEAIGRKTQEARAGVADAQREIREMSGRIRNGR